MIKIPNGVNFLESKEIIKIFKETFYLEDKDLIKKSKINSFRIINEIFSEDNLNKIKTILEEKGIILRKNNELIDFFRELIGNSVEAEATEIQTELIFENNMFIFSVLDNGKGVEAKKTQEKGEFYTGGEGLGLDNLRNIGELKLILKNEKIGLMYTFAKFSISLEAINKYFGKDYFDPNKYNKELTEIL